MNLMALPTGLSSNCRSHAGSVHIESGKASRPDEIWATDFMYLHLGGRTYSLVIFLDEYSRQIVHHALAPSMDGATASVEAQSAIEQFLREKGGEIPAEGMPRVRTDNGSCYISREFRGVFGRTPAWASADQTALP